ncbi:hypothetical protein [uncultured Draconibacterium sp.]|nr:hypothetical protein [uncultured Draconibacterium sp.]
MYLRYLSDLIKKRIGSGKAIIVIGPRQGGAYNITSVCLMVWDY